jgi:regulator of cell morphogenesis and NO signaling
MSITADQTLGELVTLHPDLIRPLERLGLDYCCGGQRTLPEACRESGLDPEEVLALLAHALAPSHPADYADLGPAELVDHIEALHHAYLHEEMPRLSMLAEKVAGVHGDRHPELIDVEATYAELRAELDPHLMKEERVLFPIVRDLAADPTAQFHCGSVRNPISVMLAEHDRAGSLLARLRQLTNGYEAPADGCASYQALYQGLAQLEADTHLHIHKENNLLFPAVVALDAEGAAGSVAGDG